MNKYFKGLTRDSFLLAFVSLFADIATEMLYPVLPIYLTQNLKAGGSIVGLVEGVAIATQNIIQGFSGWLSDKLKRRKYIALAGYIAAALAKPLIGFSSVWQGVLGARFLDRLGTGVRSAPRDALIASSADDRSRGKAFGLEGIGDNLGAFLGPIVAIFLLFSLHIDIRYIFYLAAIPGFAAVVMMLFVKEKSAVKTEKTKVEITTKHFPKKYWQYLFVIGLFGLGNSSNSFLILQTKSIGISLELTILIYAFFNLVAALASYPSGFLSDKQSLRANLFGQRFALKFGRRNILLISFIIFIITYSGFAFSKNFLLITFLFILYGVYQGIFRSVGKTLATDLVPQHLRASGIGWYSTTIGLSSLVASIAAGQLWDKINHQSVFIFGAIFAVLGTVALMILFKNENISHSPS